MRTATPLPSHTRHKKKAHTNVTRAPLPCIEKGWRCRLQKLKGHDGLSDVHRSGTSIYRKKIDTQKVYRRCSRSPGLGMAEGSEGGQAIIFAGGGGDGGSKPFSVHFPCLPRPPQKNKNSQEKKTGEKGGAGGGARETAKEMRGRLGSLWLSGLGLGARGRAGARARVGKGLASGHPKKRTAPSVPKWSPTSVLTGPDQA